jgi:hypothetical protein
MSFIHYNNQNRNKNKQIILFLKIMRYNSIFSTTKESLQCLLKKAFINKYILMILYNCSYFFTRYLYVLYTKKILCKYT